MNVAIRKQREIGDTLRRTVENLQETTQRWRDEGGRLLRQSSTSSAPDAGMPEEPPKDP